MGKIRMEMLQKVYENAFGHFRICTRNDGHPPPNVILKKKIITQHTILFAFLSAYYS